MAPGRGRYMPIAACLQGMAPVCGSRECHLLDHLWKQYTANRRTMYANLPVQLPKRVRNDVTKATRRGITVQQTPLTTGLLPSIMDIFESSTERQGEPIRTQY